MDRLWRQLTLALAPLAAAFGVIAAIQAVELKDRHMQVAWGTVPEWLAAGGTFVAIVAVLLTTMGYRHQIQARNEDEEHRREVEKRRQAVLLSIWPLNIGSARPAAPVQGQPPSIINVAAIGLINASEVVFHDVIVAAICKPSPTPLPIMSGGEIQFTTPVPWDQARDRLACGTEDALPPGRWKVGLRLGTTSVIVSDLHLFFRDHQGQYWWRNPQGNLTPLAAPTDRSTDGRRRHIEAALGEPETNGPFGILVAKPLGEAEST